MKRDKKLEGDAALNKSFQQVYSDGPDEVSEYLLVPIVKGKLNSTHSTIWVKKNKYYMSYFSISVKKR